MSRLRLFETQNFERCQDRDSLKASLRESMFKQKFHNPSSVYSITGHQLKALAILEPGHTTVLKASYQNSTLKLGNIKISKLLGRNNFIIYSGSNQVSQHIGTDFGLCLLIKPQTLLRKTSLGSLDQQKVCDVSLLVKFYKLHSMSINTNSLVQN